MLKPNIQELIRFFYFFLLNSKILKKKEGAPLKILVFSGTGAFVDGLAGHFSRSRKPAESKTPVSAMIQFERISLPEGLILHLYKMPVEKRFSFMWEALSSDAHAYVIAIEDEKGVENAEFIHSFCQKRFPGVPGVLVNQGRSAVEGNPSLPSEIIPLAGDSPDYDRFLSHLFTTMLS
ncbi:hypothetical protein HY745_14365, partial [Candidatus Desantisbacteria bacterium]|nr:hypothetical protein [Candidatus Desantisbacteria bacterium]